MWVFSSHSFWTSSSLDVPAGVTQEEGHTGFLIHILSAMRTLIFLARRIQPVFLSLVDREVEFCVLTNDLIVLHPLGIFFYFFIFFCEKNPVCRDRTHVPTCQKVTWLSLSYRGDRRFKPRRTEYYPQKCVTEYFYCLSKNVYEVIGVHRSLRKPHHFDSPRNMRRTKRTNTRTPPSRSACG